MGECSLCREKGKTPTCFRSSRGVNPLNTSRKSNWLLYLVRIHTVTCKSFTLQPFIGGYNRFSLVPHHLNHIILLHSDSSSTSPACFPPLAGRPTGLLDQEKIWQRCPPSDGRLCVACSSGTAAGGRPLLTPREATDKR